MLGVVSYLACFNSCPICYDMPDICQHDCTLRAHVQQGEDELFGWCLRVFANWLHYVLVPDIVCDCEVVFRANPCRVANRVDSTQPAPRRRLFQIYWHYPSNPPLIHSLGPGIWSSTSIVRQPLKFLEERWNSCALVQVLILQKLDFGLKNNNKNKESKWFAL